ncbi:MAG: tetratricopeptide repeat protein [Solibacillus sp.]
MHFQYQLEDKHLNGGKWAFENGSIKGDLQIYVDGELVFNESNMKVVELATQLGKWLDLARHGVMRDFAYASRDHDEEILHFAMQQNGIRLSSSLQKFELEKLFEIGDVIEAVTKFLTVLNMKLHEIDYFEKLDRYLHNHLSENTKALLLFEQNEYDDAFALLKKLADEQPSVQSLNNLAWMYLKEEEDLETAKRILREVLVLNPQSYFPYNMLGEIALTEKQYEEAEMYLTKSLQFQHSDEALFNLGIVYFYQSRFEEAAQQFSKVTGYIDLTLLYEVFGWIKAGKFEKATAKLASWTPDMEDYVSATEIADVYVELNEHVLAKKWFEYSLGDGHLATYIISRYAYVLMVLQEEERCQQFIDNQLVLNAAVIQEIEQEPCEENWTELDKQESLEESQAEQMMLETLFEQLSQGYVPQYDYELYPTSSCYLFGCAQHGHAEYKQ